ncbi:unnamed protein product [Adineta steineri]|uniref:Uncharacterized protein n=1 Tax=Adineta steineri TaxID=433720 RepID=A0A815S6P2_9BILA|nr:unnamed protein product [Adineta steineri]
MMNIQDDNFISEPSHKSIPTNFKTSTFKGLRLVNITLIINLKENQSHMTPISTVQTESTQFPSTKPIINDVTKIQLSDVSVVGNSLTRCVIKSNDVLEITTHLSEGGCVVPFKQLKLPTTKSLSNQVLEFDMEFLAEPYDDVGRHGGIYYGNHSFDRWTNGNTVVDWIDRTHDRGYRFYQTGRYPDDSNILVLQKKEPVNHLKIIIKSNGEHIIVAENTIWKNLTSNAVQLLNKPYLGFWAWSNNHLRISNFIIRPYTRCGLDE